jgi:hypothetical protein
MCAAVMLKTVNYCWLRVGEIARLSPAWYRAIVAWSHALRGDMVLVRTMPTTWRRRLSHVPGMQPQTGLQMAHLLPLGFIASRPTWRLTCCGAKSVDL